MDKTSFEKRPNIVNPLPHRNSAKPFPPTKELRHLVDGLLADSLTRLEFARLEELLEENAAARRYYLEIVGNESLLPPLLEGMGRMSSEARTAGSDRAVFSRPLRFVGMAAAAACLFLSAGFWWSHHSERSKEETALLGDAAPSPSPAPVAHLESESQAVWVGVPPGEIGAPLAAGTLELRSGLAELRFASGVLVALEAPARLDLIDPMKCRLTDGTVVVDVPESGKGFAVETPEGRAVDHGTRFAVTLDKHTDFEEFEVLKGRISVFHEESGEMMALSETQAARMTKTGIETLQTLPSQQLESSKAGANLRHLQTRGREASIVFERKTPREKTLNPELLMVKRDDPQRTGSPKDRRSLIEFDLDRLEPAKIHVARLLLNQVPTGIGFASALPEVCTFEVYGIRDDAKLESWPAGSLRWDQAPGSEGSSRKIDETEVTLLAASTSRADRRVARSASNPAS
jgi:hypothetical protein